MSHKIVTIPQHGDRLVDEEGRATPTFQLYLDGLTEKLNDTLLGDAIILESYTVATLPVASDSTGGLLFVSDETGGAVPAFSDGVNWRRVTDRVIVS